jgi:hypothetical protein
VGLVLLLLVAGGAFAVGGTIGGQPGDLIGRLGLLVLLTRAGEVAAAQEPRRAVLQAGDQVAGLLPASGRLGKPLLGLLSLGGRKVQQARLVARAGVEQGDAAAGAGGADSVVGGVVEAPTTCWSAPMTSRRGLRGRAARR